MSKEESVPQGWYPDPSNEGQIRFWDGLKWTDNVAVRDSVIPDVTLDTFTKDGFAKATSEAKASFKRSRELAESREKSMNEFFAKTHIVHASIKRELSREVARKLIANSNSETPPWFVMNCGIDGVMAAYEKELMILKVGAMTGFMSSATGGGRITHFPYRHIVSIEYNTGFVTGVLEIITAGYDGGMNKDYWAVKSKNSSGGDPRQQNNTLPMSKSFFNQITPQLNQIRELIDASHTVRIEGGIPAVAAPSIADELKKLAELHESGVLSLEEFTAAKQNLLSQEKK